MFKLYHTAGLSYPPVLHDALDARGAGLAALQMKSLSSAAPACALPTLAAPDAATLASVKTAIKSVLAAGGTVDDAHDSADSDSEDEDDNVVPDSKEAKELAEKRKLQRALRKLFKGMTFLLSREVCACIACCWLLMLMSLLGALPWCRTTGAP